jgi:hypothetical protein
MKVRSVVLTLLQRKSKTDKILQTYYSTERNRIVNTSKEPRVCSYWNDMPLRHTTAADTKRKFFEGEFPIDLFQEL